MHVSPPLIQVFAIILDERSELAIIIICHDLSRQVLTTDGAVPNPHQNKAGTIVGPFLTAFALALFPP